MQVTRIIQASLFENYSEHEFGVQLKILSCILDEHTEILPLIEKNLRDETVKKIGRNGLSDENLNQT